MSKVAATSRASTAYHRRRAVTACQVCRARRTKCDQKRPRCSFCEKTDAECIFEPSALSTYDSASLAILERLDAVERKLDIVQRTVADPPGLDISQTRTTNPVAFHAAVNSREVPQNLLPENLDAVLRWPVFQGVLCPVPPSPQLSNPTTQRPSLLDDELNPSATNEYLDAFFSHVHIKNPVLDEAYIRRIVRRVSLEGPGWDSESCLTLIVCANGAIIRPFSAPSLTGEELSSSTGSALFAAAHKRIGSIIDSAGVVQAQCMFFAGVYLMTSLRPFDAWRSFLQGLAICQSFGFMDPRRTAASGSECGTPAEESIYWSCWKSERELRWELGLPDFSSGLSLGPPQRFPSVPLTNDNQMLRAWYFYLSEISLWRLEAEARKDITICLSQEQQQNGASPHLLSRLTEFSESCRQQLVEWRNSLPLILSISDTEPSTTDTDVLKFVLRGRTTYVNELITWPFIIYALNGREMVPAARALVAKGLDAHLGRLTTNMPGFYHRHHGTWLLIRTSARSACILVAAARTPIRDLLPVGWQEAVEATIEMLYFWRTEVETIEETAIFLRFIMAELGELY